MAPLFSDIHTELQPPDLRIEMHVALTANDDVVAMPAVRAADGVRLLQWRELTTSIDPTHALLATALRNLSPTSEPWLDLGVAGPGLWSVLTAMHRIGINFRQAHSPGPGPGRECHLDDPITVQMAVAGHGRADAAVTAQLVDVADNQVTSKFYTLGTARSPHGVAWFDSGRILHMAPLAAGTHPLALRLAHRRHPMIVPAADIPEFTTTAVPRLTAAGLHVVDPDSILHTHPPAEPTAVLTITPGQSPDICCATWTTTYTDGDATSGVTDQAQQPSHRRDTRAETRLWGELAPIVAMIGATAHNWIHQRESTDEDSPALGVPTFTLTAPEMIDLRGTVLPALDPRDDLRIDITDSIPDYRQPTKPPRVQFQSVAGPGRDWLRFNVVVDVDGTTIPIQTVIEQLAGGRTTLIVGNDICLDISAIPDLERLSKLLKEAREVGEIRDDGTISLPSDNATLWDDLLECGEPDAGLAETAERASALSAGPPHVEPSARLHATLRGYQRDGLDWLVFLLEQRIGGILADDMGLGKTVQLLAAAAHRLDVEPAAQFLVIAPTSVVSNWVAETSKFLPGVTVAAITTSREARPGSPSDTAALTITTYTLLRNNSAYFARRQWAMVVCDEAQMIKTPTVKVRRTIAALSTDTIIAATGTPIENSLIDLWSLLNVAVPHLFPRKADFVTYYQTPIEHEGDGQRLAELRARIAPMMLRRTKEQVVTELPAKQEQYVQVELGPAHRRIYDRTLNRERQKALELLSDPEENRFLILTALTRLRQLSLHPGLVNPADEPVGSAKIDWLVEHLPPLATEGHKVLVFSVFPSFLRLVRPALEDAGVTVAYLDGTTAVADRAEQIADFTHGSADVFLIGIKSGGFGINLVVSDYVIITDPWWNPATESQAVDRAHRIGQTRPVNVYRLVATDTVEGKVIALQNSKRALAASVIEDDAGPTTFNSNDLRELLA